MPLPEDAVAHAVVGRHLRLRRGETLTVETWSSGIAWARAILLEARRRGVAGTLVYEDEETFFRSLSLPIRRLPAPSTGALAAETDAYVYLPGPEAFLRLLGLPFEELEAIRIRHGPAWERRARGRGLRALRVNIAAAGPPAAARYGVDPESWRRELLRASLVPPERLARAADAVVRRLAGARRVRIRHPNGTDLSVELAAGPPYVADGRFRPARNRAFPVWAELPSGMVAVGPREGTAQGRWESNRPSFDRFASPPVWVGGRFRLARGRLVEFAFERGGRAFAAAFARGGRGAGRLTAVTVGLNPAVHRAPEVGALARGTVGLLLGDDRRIGGPHRARFSHLTELSGADVDVDGRPAWRHGRPVDPTGSLQGARGADGGRDARRR